MEIQRILGSDIIMAFDECPKGGAETKYISHAVDRTTKWVKRCKIYLDSNPQLYNHEQTLYPIIQGGVNNKLRKISIESILNYAECGIAIGGLAVGEEKNAMFDTIEYCETLLPKTMPRYLMGVGKPTDIVKAVRRGMDMFDCVMPTRNGRNGQIFTSEGTININNEKFKDDYTLIDEKSDHAFGRMFTKSYVRHLFNVKEILGLRIASTLNLSYYFRLMRTIRENINSGTFDSWSKSWLNKMSNHKGM
jgi:queuine tRNA-ribosyltransferase